MVARLTIIVMPRRGYRRGRNSGMRAVIQSYKKVIDIIPVSVPASFTNENLVIGVDSIAAGQTSNIDPNVPTGAIIKYIEVHHALANATAGNVIVDTAFQYTVNNATGIDPVTVGGSTARNQVLHMSKFAVGPNQNQNRIYKFKIPAKFQRVREGRRWVFSFRLSGTLTHSLLAIYKFYR